MLRGTYQIGSVEAATVAYPMDGRDRSQEAPPRLPERRHCIYYVVGFCAVQVCVLALVFVLAATPWFLTHDAYPGMYQSGYSLRLEHADCDVLIYGDSSSLTGLHPQVIEKITGFKTCNISEGTTIQDIVGSNFPLDSYLKHNRRPKYLLTMYTPSMFRPSIPAFTDYYPEGMLYLLQYDRNRANYRTLWHHKQWLLNFDFWVGRQLVQELVGQLPGFRKHVVDARKQRAEHGGVWPYPLPAEDHCVRTAYHINPADVQYDAANVDEMRRTYGVDGTTVIINMAPVPDCDVTKDVYRTKSEGLHDNRFEVMPISEFNEGDVHFTPEGGTHISVEAAHQILALEQKKHNASAGASK